MLTRRQQVDCQVLGIGRSADGSCCCVAADCRHHLCLEATELHSCMFLLLLVATSRMCDVLRGNHARLMFYRDKYQYVGGAEDTSLNRYALLAKQCGLYVV